MSYLKQLLVPIADAFFACLDTLDALRGRSAVRQISIEQLVERQAAAAAKPDVDFVLVDVRSPSEQEVSVIPSAITKNAFERSPDEHRGKTVIAYCTAGGRSYLYARKLARQNRQTLNLKPGIVGWCNAHLPLQTIDGQTTRHVAIDTALYSVPAEYLAVN